MTVVVAAQQQFLLGLTEASRAWAEGGLRPGAVGRGRGRLGRKAPRGDLAPRVVPGNLSSPAVYKSTVVWRIVGHWRSFAKLMV